VGVEQKVLSLLIGILWRPQRMVSVKNIQAHLRQAKSDTTANEYMQKLPQSSVQGVVGSV
jgi:hypothetical protein